MPPSPIFGRNLQFLVAPFLLWVLSWAPSAAHAATSLPPAQGTVEAHATALQETPRIDGDVIGDLNAARFVAE